MSWSTTDLEAPGLSPTSSWSSCRDRGYHVEVVKSRIKQNQEYYGICPRRVAPIANQRSGLVRDIIPRWRSPEPSGPVVHRSAVLAWKATSPVGEMLGLVPDIIPRWRSPEPSGPVVHRSVVLAWKATSPVGEMLGLVPDIIPKWVSPEPPGPVVHRSPVLAWKATSGIGGATAKEPSARCTIEATTICPVRFAC